MTNKRQYDEKYAKQKSDDIFLDFDDLGEFSGFPKIFVFLEEI